MATANIIAEFQHLGIRLDLVSFPKNEGRYNLGRDFVPPASYMNMIYGPAVDWGQRVLDEQEGNTTWSFSVEIYGSKPAEIKRGELVINEFLQRAGNEADPLVFAWRPWGDYDFEPVHGLFAKLARYEVVNAVASLEPGYQTIIGPGRFAICKITLTTKPLSLHRILAGIAAGGILDDIYSSPAKRSRGLMVLPNRTNFCTNPIFDNPDDWDFGWTADAGVYALQNTDPEFVLFGRASARLVFDGTVASGDFVQSLNVGSTATHCVSAFVKRQDKGTIGTLDFRFQKNGGTVSLNDIISVGNGWYFAWGSTAGVNASVEWGIRFLTEGDFLYFTGFTVEAGSMPSFPLYGDQVGAVWSGTPHESSSSRGSTYYYRLPTAIITPNYSTLTIRVGWTPLLASANLPNANYYLFDDGNFFLLYDKNNNRFSCGDGTNTVTYSKTFTGREKMIFHLTTSIANGLKLYLNGSLVASTTYKVPVVSSKNDYMYIGTSEGGSANPAYGVFFAFGTYNREMTATQVLLEYNQASPIIADDERLDDLAWAWTKNGGGTIYNQNDSSEGNYMIAGGFGGEFVTPELIASLSQNFITIPQVHLGRLSFPQDEFSQFIPGITSNARSLLFHDEQGTPDANSSGGEYQSRSVGTSETRLGYSITAFSRQNSFFAKQRIRALARVRDSGGGATANLQTAIKMYYGYATHVTRYRNLPALGTLAFGLIDFGEVSFPPVERFRPAGAQVDAIMASAVIKRKSGGALTLLVDYMALFPNPIQITCESGSAEKVFILRGNSARVVESAWSAGRVDLALRDYLQVLGVPLVFEGGQLNLVNFALGEINGADGATITWTVTVNELWLIVRNNIG